MFAESTIGDVFTGLAMLATAIFSGIAAVYAARAKVAVGEVKKDVMIIERATNSMKDALVLATGKAAFLQGEKSGQKHERAQPGTVADGDYEPPAPAHPPASETTKPTTLGGVVSGLRDEVAAVPEKTAQRVVELQDEEEEKDTKGRKKK